MKTPRTLNAGQHAAAEGFLQFLMSEERELIISGPGGVGKSFLMGELSDTVMKRYEDTCELMGIKPQYDEVIMTATTNKAASVLSAAIGTDAGTIHSFMNLTIKEDWNTGRMKLVPTKSWKIYERKIIFIDECSMIDSPLRAKILEGTANCKIIYVGDHCQMAPVEEPISPIYRGKLPFYELTEPMRTGDPHLLAVNQQLRTTVETGIFLPIKIVPGVIDLLGPDEMAKEIDTAFFKQNPEIRVLAYSNARVNEYNDHIRELRGITAPFVEGEMMVNNQAFSTGGSPTVGGDVGVTIQRIIGRELVPMGQDGAELEVVTADIVTEFGQTLSGVSLPVDKAHHQSLIKYYAKIKNWHMYFLLKNAYMDLRPRDAATVHKAQGSSLSTVYIDIDDLNNCRNPNVTARLLYVAFSRARHRIVLFGQLADKFGGYA